MMSDSFPSSSRDSQEDAACALEGSRTQTLEECQPQPPVLQLRLNQPKNRHQVKWTSDTVDNEFMGKKKSKCCCIYEKPKVFGESSTSEEEDDDDNDCTAHCKGHKKKCYRHKGQDHDHDNHNQDPDGAGAAGPSNHQHAE